jgi:hypothetical protein
MKRTFAFESAPEWGEMHRRGAFFAARVRRVASEFVAGGMA